MSKKELVNAIAEKSNLSEKDARAAIDAFVETVTESMKEGDKVQLLGFGTFEIIERPERNGRNPSTGENIIIPASKSVKFKASKVFKEAIE